MIDTTEVQYTRTHWTANVSMQRSGTILIMKETIIRVNDGWNNHMSQES